MKNAGAAYTQTGEQPFENSSHPWLTLTSAFYIILSIIPVYD